MRRDDEGPERGHQQRVAVGRRARHATGADGAGGAGLVLDEEALAGLLGELLGHLAGDHVHRATRGVGHHDLDRLGGPGLGKGRGDQGQVSQEGGGQNQVECFFHGCLGYCVR